MTRPRLQLHLSTLLIVTLLAAGLVWLNVRGFYKPSTSSLIVRSAYGWPWIVSDITVSSFPHLVLDWRLILLNVIACLTLLAVAAAAIEWLTRRMKRGAP